MLSQDQGGPFGLVSELAAVAEVAGARLRAETDADDEAARAAAEQLVTAASAAMAAGHSLSDITEAEARGQEDVRDALRGDTLRSVERTGRRARETRAEHHQTIARAVRLGLSTREIAAAADVTHGTVRAISNRLAGGAADGGPADVSHVDAEPHGEEGREAESQWAVHGDGW
jgi:DNA invertase Pin-like site-specific DNA recombinase